MSVPTGKRKEGKLEAATKALELVSYTLKITSNKNVFVPDYQHSLTDKIVEYAISIYVRVRAANDINVGDKPEYAKERLSGQRKALHEAKYLLYLIDLAKPVFHLRSRRVRHWTKLVLETGNKIKHWHDSDCDRYRHLFEQGNS